MTLLGWILSLALGVVAAALPLAWLRGKRRSSRQRFWALALLFAALIYVGFAVVGSTLGLVDDPPHTLGYQGLGVMVYGALGALGMRRPQALAAGWALHVVWDLGHRHAAWVPEWYVAACLSFDLVVAGALFRDLFGPQHLFSRHDRQEGHVG